MKTPKWNKKKINSDWEQHQESCKVAFETLGFEVVQEDTSGHQGISKTGKGKCDLQVLNKDGTIFGYYECKRTTSAITMPQQGKANPSLKLHQMEFLKDMWMQGFHSGIIFKYVTDEDVVVIIMTYEKIMDMVGKYIRTVKGNVVLPSFTLSRLIELGVSVPFEGTVYDFSELVE
jgi:hypothetical protein